MQPVSHIVRIGLPNYLAGLPVPDSFTGWFKLGVTDWVRLIPFFAAVGGLSYSVYRVFVPSAIKTIRTMDTCVLARCHYDFLYLCFYISETLYYLTVNDQRHLNKTIRKEEAKVADIIPIESLGDKTALCRCWKSKNWPYCDGSHTPHNNATGDNVGPVVIKRAAP